MHMKPSEELFQLIKSLTKSEKRYFHLHFSGEKVYQRLFDLIERQEMYDEKEIREKLHIKQPHVYKNYLYHSIMKSLRSFHAECSLNHVIYNHLQNFEVLFSKGLMKHAEKALSKSKALAQANQKRFLLSEIYQLEQKLLFKMPRRKEALSGMDFFRQLDILKDQSDIVKGQQLAYQITRHFYRTGYLINQEIKKDITAIYASMNEITMQSNDFLIYKYWGNYLFHCMTGDFGAALGAAEDFIRLTAHSESILDLPVLSCEIAYSHAFCTIKLNELYGYYFTFHAFPDDILIQLPESHFASKSIGLMNLYLFYVTGKYKEGLDYWESLQVNNSDEVKELTVVQYHAACMLHFCVGNYKEALKFSNNIINESTAGVKDDFYIAHLLIRIIIHFEMGSYDVAEALILRTKKPLKEYSFFHPFDTLLLKKLKSAMQAETKSEFCRHMQELESGFDLLCPKLDNLNNFKFYFNFKDWIRSKATNKIFAETIMESNSTILVK